MALLNTYKIGFDSSKYHGVQISKDGSEAYRNFPLVDGIHSGKFDYMSKELMINGSSGLSIYTVTDNSIDFKYTLEGMHYYRPVSASIRDENTGKYYATDYYGYLWEFGSDGIFIQKVLVDHLYEQTWSKSVSIDYTNNRVIVSTTFTNGTTNLQPGTISPFEFMVDLSTFVVTNGENVADSLNYYYAKYYPVNNEAYTTNCRNFSMFNKFDGNMYRFFDGESSANYSNSMSVLISRPGVISEARTIPLSRFYPDQYEPSSSDQYWSIDQGINSGNFYIRTNRLIIVTDSAFKLVVSFDLFDETNTDLYYLRTKTVNEWAFNGITEELTCTYDSAGLQYTHTFDRLMNLTSVNSYAISIENQTYVDKYVTAIGSIEVGSVETEASVVVFPVNQSLEVDTTPKLVFKVGSNPIGWTQQFRLVADRDDSKISSGVATGTYERAYDSWSNGASYNGTVGWEYSTDYVEGQDPDSSGTWSALGSGDGLQSGGTNVVNGLNSEFDNYYVRMQVPAGDELLGADTNDIWYFKVFSYSKYTG